MAPTKVLRIIKKKEQAGRTGWRQHYRGIFLVYYAKLSYFTCLFSVKPPKSNIYRKFSDHSKLNVFYLTSNILFKSLIIVTRTHARVWLELSYLNDQISSQNPKTTDKCMFKIDLFYFKLKQAVKVANKWHIKSHNAQTSSQNTKIPAKTNRVHVVISCFFSKI